MVAIYYIEVYSTNSSPSSYTIFPHISALCASPIYLLHPLGRSSLLFASPLSVKFRSPCETNFVRIVVVRIVCSGNVARSKKVSNICGSLICALMLLDCSALPSTVKSIFLLLEIIVRQQVSATLNVSLPHTT